MTLTMQAGGRRMSYVNVEVARLAAVILVHLGLETAI